MTTLSEALDVYIKQAFEKYSPLLIQLFYFILFFLMELKHSIRKNIHFHLQNQI